MTTIFSQAQSYQKPAIMSTDSLVKGIYLDFSEFQNNNPSIKVDFRSNESNLPLNSIYNNMVVSRLNIMDENGVLIEFNTEHWGICDGKQVFIVYKGKYQKVSLDGKYSQFTATTRGYSSSNMNIMNMDYFLNITNNNINLITVSSVEEILQKENILLYNEFIKDKKKKMMMYTYINRLNEILNNQ